MSNLLAFGYRQFLIDLYWLPASGKWSLCPTSSFPLKDARGNEIECAPELGTVGWVWELWNDWVEQTEFNTLVSLSILVFSLHPDRAGGSGGASPGPVWRVSEGFPDDSVYTPVELREDREDLNVTWLNGGDEGDDEARYFQVQTRPDGGLKSDNAWPSESFLNFEKGKRLVMGFGEIRVEGFQEGGDGGYIFGSGDVGWPYEGRDARCFYDPGKTNVGDVNNSWAVMVDDEKKPWTQEGILTPVNCGYSPLINTTSNITPPPTSSNTTTTTTNTTTQTPQQLNYFELLKGTIWSWAPGEPAPPQANLTEDQFHCAAMSTTTGRWHVTDCNAHLRPACRVNDRPYQWTPGPRAGTYFDAQHLCPKDTAFDVPRTGLENQYLLHSTSKSKSKSSSPLLELTISPLEALEPRALDTTQADTRIWIDLQSLSHPSCWVRGGPDGAETRCPYGTEDMGNKTVIVPTVAAIIVLVVAGLMVFVKIGSRRRERVRKRRRKQARRWGKEGWEYEGVPA